MFKKYFGVLVLYAKRYVGSYEVAEDIVQDVFLHLWENGVLETIKVSYLFACVRNKAINYSKKNKKQLTLKEVPISLISCLDEDEEIVLHYEKMANLFKAFDKLPPKTLEVLKKIYLEERKYSDVANELGLSLNTIRSHMYTAFKLIKKSI
ncbi:MAG: sigma-70 family RNA polymerase sigma factor [Bacteroidales bacterium]|nr:sigma-70 family RNA polymerase sigma factor [Bacteroidales bacterium]MDD4031981.1 sigma-70 family RNA polymerase sigma factor [Bacteroidales bacterium]